MAAPFPTTYYIGLGTAISNLGIPTELSGGSYARLACGFTGTALSGLTQTTSAWVVAAAPSPAVPITYGLIYDAVTGGNLIAYFNWNGPYTLSTTAMPAQTINIVFNTYISTALNLALSGGSGTSGSLLDAGAQIGTVNGQPLLSGVRLGINPGGVLAAHLGQGQWVGSMDVQGTLYTNTFASGNMNLGVTALAGGASSASTPILTGFWNRVAVVATAGDSVLLPSPSNGGAPGTMLLVSNGGANAMKIIADTPAGINGATISLSMATLSSCTFFRESPTVWRTIPTVPS